MILKVVHAEANKQDEGGSKEHMEGGGERQGEREGGSFKQAGVCLCL